MQIIGPHDPWWQAFAACVGVDGEMFFPVSDRDAHAALAICGTCRVRASCLVFAMEQHERYGVWGGTTETDRARMTPADHEDALHAAEREASLLDRLPAA